MKRPWLFLLLAVGCGGPDTLHYRLLDPHLVTVCVDGQPAIPPPGEEPIVDEPHASMVRAGEGQVADASFVLERNPAGIYGRWSTTLPMAIGPMFELVGPDGWVATRPMDAPVRAWNDQLVFDVVPRLTRSTAMRSYGYATTLAAASTQMASEHLITISTPRTNVIQAEQRGDPARLSAAAFALAPGIIFSGAGAGLFAIHGRGDTAKVGGGMLAAVGVALDVTAIYEYARGSRHMRLHAEN